jgi:hypothetical protein
MVPGSDAYHAVNESYPPLIWWRRGARTGVIAAEQFANSGSAWDADPTA